MRRAAFIYSDNLLSYDFGQSHVLKPERMKMTFELLKYYGIFEHDNVKFYEPHPASKEDILPVHDEAYIDVVEKVSRGELVYDAYMYGFRYPDNPPFTGMYEASLLYTGASIQAAELVMTGEADVAFNVSGGLHHAQRKKASGFCIFNDPAAAIHRMLEKWDRVVYIDIDAHHGDGVQSAFYDTNRVLTCSIHESGRYIFPGTGFVEEIGSGEGTGYSLNAPLAPYTDDDTLLQVLNEGVMSVIRAFKPQAVFLQLGTDGHFEDPIAQLYYTSQGWLQAVRTILDLDLPTVAVGGGGYNLYTVCRLWTLAFGEMAGFEVPEETPDEFFEKYRIRVVRDIFQPEASDSQKRIVADTAHETLQKIQSLVFPYHQL